jgi:two-component system, OmpR family, sensor histidine kinase KdpD
VRGENRLAVASTGVRALGGERPPRWVGGAVAVLAVLATTAAIYPLKGVAPIVSLSIVYLPAVVLVSAYWGLSMGLLTSLASATAFNFFHIPPVGRFTIADGRNWVALAAFVTVAAVVSKMADIARNRAVEAERRRGEADLVARLAQALLTGEQTHAALAATAETIAAALRIPSAAIELGVSRGNARQIPIALCTGEDDQIATLLVDRNLGPETAQRLRTHVASSLGALVAIALHRDAVQREAVETAALRRSDDLKTALLQAVSHDLRTPVTAIVAAGHALGGRSLTPDERRDLSVAVVEEGERLSALIDKLLELSRLQAGRADPRRELISVEEVLLAARDALRDRAGEVRLSLQPDTPAVRADAVQLEHAFVNLLENALRFSPDLPVLVDVRRVGREVTASFVDRGPGIDPAEQERIFEPFYRGVQPSNGRAGGSGLGLAIAKGFVEANGGTISVDSLPGRGTSFVVTLPAEPEVAGIAHEPQVLA